MVTVKGRVEGGERLGKQSSPGSKVTVAKRKGKEEEQRLLFCPGADMLRPQGEYLVCSPDPQNPKS